MKLHKVALSTLIMALSLPACADTLHIFNNTQYSSTVTANGGPCSSNALGEQGITRPGQHNYIPGDKLKNACLKKKDGCIAEVFMTDHCSDDKDKSHDAYHKADAVATVIIDVNKGIQSVNVKSAKFKVKASNFDAEISEASNSTKWLKWMFGKK